MRFSKMMFEMIDAFDASRISLGEPVFDVEKLKWLNGRWLREDVSDAVFAERLREWAFNEANLMPVVPLIKERVDVMSEVAPMVAYLFAGVPALNEADLAHKKLEPDDVKRLLQFALWRFEALRLWESEAIQATFHTLAEQLDRGVGPVVLDPVAWQYFDPVERGGIPLAVRFVRPCSTIHIVEGETRYPLARPRTQIPDGRVEHLQAAGARRRIGPARRDLVIGFFLRHLVPLFAPGH